MGQYYRPILLDGTKTKPLFYAVSYDVGNGAKLMEHSWMKNDFVAAIEKVLINMPMSIVWAGDYADEEPFDSLSSEMVKRLVEDDYDLEKVKESGVNLYTMSQYTGSKIDINPDNIKSDKLPSTPVKYKYLINYDKKMFVDKTKVPNNDGWQIHPLPLLTCEGNGRGGGDYRGDDSVVGSWSRDVIGISSLKKAIPKDFTELLFTLAED
jgi:hypothetical protein